MHDGTVASLTSQGRREMPMQARVFGMQNLESATLLQTSNWSR